MLNLFKRMIFRFYSNDNYNFSFHGIDMDLPSNVTKFQGLHIQSTN
jgi:hypothetical protein